MFVVGETETETPVPAGVPPHEPEYQCQDAPGESVPVTWRVEFVPSQTGDVEDDDTGLAGTVATVTVTVEHADEQFAFSARA